MDKNSIKPRQSVWNLFQKLSRDTSVNTYGAFNNNYMQDSFSTTNSAIIPNSAVTSLEKITVQSPISCFFKQKDSTSDLPKLDNETNMRVTNVLDVTKKIDSSLNICENLSPKSNYIKNGR